MKLKSVLLSLCLTALTACVHACSCLGHYLSIEYYNTVDGILIGEVLSVKKHNGFSRIQVKVITAYKGSTKEYIDIDTELTSCQLAAPKIGDTWLFYFNIRDHRNTTDRCMGNAHSKDPTYTRDTTILKQISAADSITFDEYRAIGKMSSGIPEGYWRFYAHSQTDTVLVSDGWYINGERHGVWKDYAPNGSHSSVGHYCRGQLLETRSFNSDSILIHERQLWPRSGEQKIDRQYYPDGTPYKFFIATWSGLRTKYEEYYPNGSLKVAGHFDRHGDYAGMWSYFDSSGKLTKKERPKYGE